MGTRASAAERLMRVLWHGTVIALLTVLSQIGGLAWLIAVFFSRTTRGLLLAFVIIYAALWGTTRFIAPNMDRTAVPCVDRGPTYAKSFSPLYCVLNRNYVTSDMAQRLDALATHMHQQFPGTRTRVLDAGFPFPGMPLLPHLSHDDGEKADLAFWYEGGAWRSPIGYWAFEEPRPNDPDLCGDLTGLSLRWDMDVLRPFMRSLPLDEPRTSAALEWLATNLPANGKIFIEPYLADRLGMTSEKIRFQGCRAARHDDHIHVQL